MSTQASQIHELPRPAMQGVASGILFLTFFGALWGLLGTGSLNGLVHIIALIVVGVITLVFLGIAIMFMRYAGTLPETVSEEDAATGKRIWRWFGVVFGAEAVLIALASILLSNFQLSYFIPPMTGLIVGIHFLPLARLFRVPAYYITGALLIVLALVALAALLLGLPLADPSPWNWSIFVGIGATITLWLTTLYLARFGLRMMRTSRSGSGG